MPPLVFKEFDSFLARKLKADSKTSAPPMLKLIASRLLCIK